jgi:DNA helicase IV
VTSSGVLRRLYGSRAALLRAAAGLLSDEECQSLARPVARRAGDQRWSRADLALLDEAESLIAGVRQTYGHIVVDEAQDLSAMELRMIARRSAQGSMTILGDLAQATAPAAQTDWSEALVHLDVPGARLEELTVGYRVPEPIMTFANRLLPYAAPGLRPPSSVRAGGEAPRVVAVPLDERPEAVAAEVRALANRWPLTGVVVPELLRDPITTALNRAEIAFVDGMTAATLGDHITLLPPAATKGLEFDAVVVVEPAEIIAGSGGDLRQLYVVLTRAVQHLSVVHSAPLPPALAA